MKLIETNYHELKINYSNFIDRARIVGDNFGGPSLYFHERALNEIDRNFLGNTHLEMIYATLASWGMHRMGDTKTKMVDFNKFKNSILNQKEALTELKGVKIEDLNASDLSQIISKLSNICFTIQTSESNSQIVGNSKALAHILPHLIPPIDRQYTIRFFSCEPIDFLNEKGKFKPAPNFKESDEKIYFSHIVYKTYDFINHIKADKQIKIASPFNTSYPKIFDNLIMTYIRVVSQEKNGL